MENTLVIQIIQTPRCFLNQVLPQSPSNKTFFDEPNNRDGISKTATIKYSYLPSKEEILLVWFIDVTISQ